MSCLIRTSIEEQELAIVGKRVYVRVPNGGARRASLVRPLMGNSGVGGEDGRRGRMRAHGSRRGFCEVVAVEILAVPKTPS
jgi:hypothetical protein